MTLTEESDNAVPREPITDVQSWIADLPADARRSLVALGELLIGVADRSSAKAETADDFTVRSLGVAGFQALLNEDRNLSSVQRLTVALALGELIDLHSAELGPNDYTSPPIFTQTEIGNVVYRHPHSLRAAFAPGTLLGDVPIVIGVDGHASAVHTPKIVAYVRREHQSAARKVLDSIITRSEELNPYRGHPVRAGLAMGSLTFTAIDLPTVTRSSVVVSDDVWREIDLGFAAVRDHHGMLNAHGLGARRGVLLYGPPGTGKSAVSAVVAREALWAGFTVIYVEAKAGEYLLTAVVEEAQRLGGPVLIVLEDLDLFVRERHRIDSGGLSELLQAMDVASPARILTIASTNDARTLDAAAIRTGRFDSVVEVGYPDRNAAGRILTALLRDVPGNVNMAEVASNLPEKTSGSDLREIVRRAVLTGEGEVTTSSLLDEIGAGRYRIEAPVHGQYL